MPVFSAHWKLPERRLQVDLSHEGVSTKGVEDGDGGVNRTVAERKLIGVNKIVNAPA